MKISLKQVLPVLIMLSFNAYAEVSVVVNKANGDAVDASLIKKIYLGKAKSFDNGNKIDAVTLPDSNATAEEFREKALNKSNSQYKSYWSKLVFTGKGTPPKELNSASDVINHVKGSPSAIGFVPSGEVTDDVKVVATF
jgi:hypothetical protein